MDQKFKISKNLKQELNQAEACKTKSQTPAEFNFTFNQKMNPVEKQQSQKSNKPVVQVEPKTDKMEKIQLFSPNNIQRV